MLFNITKKESNDLVKINLLEWEKLVVKYPSKTAVLVLYLELSCKINDSIYLYNPSYLSQKYGIDEVSIREAYNILKLEGHILEDNNRIYFYD